MWLAATGLTAILASASASLPAHGFFAGDSGVKLIAAKAAWENLSKPFELDLPRINGAPAPEFLSPFFVQHHGHAHAITSPLFPLLSAPFIGSFGVRGAYILPSVAFGLLLVCMGVLAERQEPGGGLIAILLTASCSPMVFYGLEYWEHLPAISALMGGILLAGERRQWKVAAAGFLFSMAALLRPEGLVFCVVGGLAAMTPLSPRSRAILGIAFVAGMAPMALFNVLHFGNPIGVHVSSNLGAFDESWASSRISLLKLWVGPNDSWAVGLALAMLFVGFLWSATSVTRIAGYSGLGLLSIAAMLGWLPRENLWATAPAVALVLAPLQSREGGSGSTSSVFGWTLVSIVAVIATAPNDGGAQWGPRYVLFAIPVLMLVSAQNVRILWRHPGAERWFARAAVVLVLVGALVTTRAAYRELRGAKRYYSRLVEATTAASHDVSFVVSNVWWFDSMNAGGAPDAAFLYAKDSAVAQVALRLTSPAAVLLATSEETEFLVPLATWTEGTCYVTRERRALTERRVVLQRIECSSATSAKPVPAR